MKKKGIVVRPIIFWALGILVLFVVMFVLIGPEQLLAKARDTAFDFGLGVLPGEAVPELSGGAIAMKEDAKKIRDAIKRGLDSTTNRCIVAYGELELEEQIGMIYDGSGGKIRFRAISSRGYTPLDVEIEARLCVVYRDAIKNLHYNVEQRSKILDPEYYEINALGIKDHGGKYQILTGDYDTHPNKHFNLKDYRYLYKADSNHVCFLTLREDLWGGCSDASDATFEGIDDDCFKKWVNEGKIQMC